jgi:hypothetical protein
MHSSKKIPRDSVMDREASYAGKMTKLDKIQSPAKNAYGTGAGEYAKEKKRKVR